MRLPNKTTLGSFLLFWFLSGATQFLIGMSGSASFEGFKDSTISAVLWMLPILVFPRYAKSLTTTIGITLWLFALPGFGYFLIYNQELTQSLMFIIFESNQSESLEYIKNYLSLNVILAYAMFTLIPIFIWKQIKPYPAERKPAYVTSLFLTMLIFMTPIKRAVERNEVDAAYRNINYHLSVAPPWQLAFGYLNYSKELKEVEKQLLNLDAIPPLENLKETTKTRPTTVVLVIGESTSRVHMGLYGYRRNTTPKLSSMRDKLTVFQNVFASRPNTIESLEQVLTFADQHNPDLYKTTPSLISLMKQAGYKTYWITNQQTLTTRNTMLTTFAKQADEQVFLNNARSQNAYSFDEKVLAPFEEKLQKNDAKKFIIVHLLGTHMKYAYRYPSRFDFYKDSEGLPDVIAKDVEKTKLVNEYDNAIRYNDYIVHGLIQRLNEATSDQDQSLLVYFSDHGEEVYDTPPYKFKGRNEGAPTYPMYAIPFVVWQSEHWQEAQKLRHHVHLSGQYDNADFLYTWSDLIGITFQDFQDKKSLLSDQFIDSTILVGDPYHQQLSILNGTRANATSL